MVLALPHSFPPWPDNVDFPMSKITHGMSMESYRALPGVSFHQLMDYKKSPAYYYAKNIQALVPDYESDAMRLGTAVHCLTLEGAAAFEKLCVKAPDQFITDGGSISKAKAAKEWAAEQDGKLILSPNEYDLTKCLADRVHANKRAHDLLSNGHAEVVSQWQHASGVECRSRADWLHNDFVVDLKTTSSLSDFEADIVKWNYHSQLAFYSDAFSRSAAYLVVIEKQIPYSVGIWRMGPGTLQKGREENDRLMLLLAMSQETDRWIGDIDERLFELPETKGNQ